MFQHMLQPIEAALGHGLQRHEVLPHPGSDVAARVPQACHQFPQAKCPQLLAGPRLGIAGLENGQGQAPQLGVTAAGRQLFHQSQILLLLAGLRIWTDPDLFAGSGSFPPDPDPSLADKVV